MNNQNTPSPIPNTTNKTQLYGNLEITVEGMTQDQLDRLLDFVIEKVESIGLPLAAIAYMTEE